MDRRKLIVGGSAAVATTLVAAVGGNLPAAASIIGVGSTTTNDHVLRVLNLVDVGRGLVNPAGIQRQFEQGYADCEAALPRDPEADDLDAWIRRRMVELCGTDSYAAAVTEIPQTRTLLAFNFLVYSQNQEVALPRLDPGMRVPAVLRTLEPDFLPVLLDRINEASNARRDFADCLQATSAELDRIVAEKLQGLPEGNVRAMNSPRDGREALEFTAGVLVILGFIYWVKAQTK